MVKEKDKSTARKELTIPVSGLAAMARGEDMTAHAHPQTRSGDCPRCGRLAFSATTHCLTGCATGEVLGLAIATTFGWSDLPAIGIAVVLAFLFGSSLTMLPLLRAGIPVGTPAR